MEAAIPSPSPSIDTPRPVAVVTGASEGFGRELTRLIARDGHDLVVVARSEARLTSLAKELESEFGIRVRVRCADLGDSDEQLAVAAELREEPQLKLLVNNAAFSIVDDFQNLPIDSVQQMIALNLGALATLSHAALNNRDFRRGGTLLNVGSVGGSWPLALDATYSSTKAAIDHFSSALAYEIAKNPELDVHVQVARLGGLKTDWSDRAMGALMPGEKPDPMIEIWLNDPADAARVIWEKTRSRKALFAADHWMARLQALIFGALPKLGTAFVYNNLVKERDRRGRQ
jgi:short-subunit dehydrogenase